MAGLSADKIRQLYVDKGLSAQEVAVRLGVHMSSVYKRFLDRICGVRPDRLRAFLYCYSDQDTKTLIKYWSSFTGIPGSQFTKPYIRTTEHTGRSMKRGLLHIRYSDKKLLRWLLGEIARLSTILGRVA